MQSTMQSSSARNSLSDTLLMAISSMKNYGKIEESFCLASFLQLKTGSRVPFDKWEPLSPSSITLYPSPPNMTIANLYPMNIMLYHARHTLISLNNDVIQPYILFMSCIICRMSNRSLYTWIVFTICMGIINIYIQRCERKVIRLLINLNQSFNGILGTKDQANNTKDTD